MIVESNLASLSVGLGDRSYPIYIGPGFFGGAVFREFSSATQALIVTNETIAPLYLDALTQSIASHVDVVESIVLPDGERYKTLDTLSQIYDRLMSLRFDRKCVLVALGGGVVGDITGFAAASYQRGVDFYQIPTTLLAQVDSSVGGKTGVNHPLGKNMIGAFHQPRAVIIDTETLSTLPDREYVAGLAEVIKYGLIADRKFLEWLDRNMAALLERDNDAITYAIKESCACKARVVAEDERESGVRAILNLGHTFGHALETATDYKHWLHGEAVGIGMRMALDLSQRIEAITPEERQFAESVIDAAGLPSKLPSHLKAQDVKELMYADKKVHQGQLRLVLLKSLGDAYVTADVQQAQLDDTLAAYL